MRTKPPPPNSPFNTPIYHWPDPLLCIRIAITVSTNIHSTLLCNIHTHNNTRIPR